jgi:hypothetical protein
MALVKNPFFGTSARGTLGSSVSFRSNKSGTIAESKPHPSNPNTVGQQFQRNAFKSLLAFWSDLRTRPEAYQAWKNQMKRNGKRISAYSEFLSTFLDGWLPGGGFGTMVLSNFTTLYYTDNPSPTAGKEFVLFVECEQHFYTCAAGAVQFDFFDGGWSPFYVIPWSLPSLNAWLVVGTGLLQIPYPGGDAYFVGSPGQPDPLNFHSGVVSLRNIPYVP